ncbi:MAG: arginine repressor [Ignavibacteriales bacterium]|nr:arginine repressor [Ignavibacteriales bacterium]MCB9247817.1 arginine repressor [Ignavibacteriales bacterium]
MSSKLVRQNKIKRILSDRIISNQEQILKLLGNEGVTITQATLSRDFADLGVIRTFTNLGVQYTLSSTDYGKEIAKLVGLEILNIAQNESMIVLRTLAGRAQGVAHYIDRLNREEILGTIGGDDTVLIIPNKVSNIEKILDILKDLITDNYKK